MKYRFHNGGAPGVLPSFGVIIDDESMTWRSDPAGHDLSKPIFGQYAVREGDAPLGSGKTFDVYPGGRVQESKK